MGSLGGDVGGGAPLAGGAGVTAGGKESEQADRTVMDRQSSSERMTERKDG